MAGRHPTRLAEYNQKQLTLLYPRELVEKDGKLYIIKEGAAVLLNGSPTSVESANKLAKAVNIGIKGITATPASFDGSSDVDITVTEVPSSIVKGLATVATSGQYSDLEGTPTIPAAITPAGEEDLPVVAGSAAVVGVSEKYARADHVHPIQTTVSGNAGTASKLAKAVAIGIEGLTATAADFDGSEAVNIKVTGVPATIVTGLNKVATSGSYEDLSNKPVIPAAISPASTEPLVASVAAIGESDEYARADHVHPAQPNVTGNAGTATKLAAAVKIGLTGVTATPASFDGSEDANITITSIPNALIAGLHKVATSGSYNDLGDKPAIPAAATTVPVIAGVAAVGSSAQYAKADHVHPAQTTITGNAATATKLAKQITINGVAFDGSTAITIPAASTNTYNTTIPVANWQGTSAPYSATVAVTGILANDNPIVDVVLSATYSTAQSQLEGYALIYRMTTAANSITAYATEKPSIAIPIQLKCVR